MNFRAEDFEGQQLYRLPVQVLRRVRAHPFTRDFVVSDLGFFPPTREHRVIRPVPLQQHVLIFVDAGRGWVEMEDQSLTLGPGQAVLMPAGKTHRYGAQARDPWSIYWFHFEGQGAADLLTWTGFTRARPVLDCPNPDGMRRHFRSVINAVDRGYREHTLLELSSALVNVLTLLHRNPPRHHRNPSFERIEESMVHMSKNLDQPLTLAKVAGHAGLSVAQFSYLFKEHTGISPMTYFNELRMQRACEYLDQTDLNIKEIAASLGFADPLYFSRTFSKCMGRSPTAYRKQV